MNRQTEETKVRGDRRSQRTRAALKGALLHLMSERGWDDIGVQDICDAANVGRSTFYTHFTNKEALLSGGFDDLRGFLTQAGRGSGEDGLFVFARGLIDHVHDNRKVFRSVVGRRSGYAVQRRFREMIAASVDSQMRQAPAGVPRQAAVQWLAGGLFDLLVWWMHARTLLPPAQVHGLFVRLAGGLVGR